MSFRMRSARLDPSAGPFRALSLIPVLSTAILDGSEKLYQKFQNKKNKNLRTVRSKRVTDPGNRGKTAWRTQSRRTREPVARVENPEGESPILLICEHASNAIPARYGDLGLGPAERESHIAWDPGALGVARHLSRALDAPLVHATVSRLVLDLNRDIAAPDSIPTLSERTPIPGNRDLDPAERAHRAREVYAPSTTRSMLSQTAAARPASFARSSPSIRSRRFIETCRAPGRSVSSSTKTSASRARSKRG